MRDLAQKRLKLEPGEGEALSNAGLLPFALMTQGEAARIMGVSRQSAQQAERRALYKIRAYWRHWKAQQTARGVEVDL